MFTLAETVSHVSSIPTSNIFNKDSDNCFWLSNYLCIDGICIMKEHQLDCFGQN